MQRINTEQGDFESAFYLAIVNTCYQIYFTKNTRNEPRKANVTREETKIWWRNVYRNWDNEQFCEKFRTNRETFNFILSIIYPYIVKRPIVPDPIEPEKQLALTIYRLAHGFFVFST